MAASGASPSSSPRLPSPPPFTEVQIGPKSPTVSDGSAASSEELFGDSQDDSSTRRIRPGTKAVDMAFGPPLIPLSQLDSPFQLQEHLKALYHNYTRPTGSSTITPITRNIATQLAEPPEGIERSLWLYELCRFLTMKVNNLIIAFFAESPPCSAQTCPEMRASEWQYLCAVHDPPKSCCAIDYCCHTLDWATNILTSPKYFPSRLTLGSDAGGGPQASMRHLTNIFRRLYRIFAHAWFQHRDVFWQVEGCDGLYVFFKAVCDVYKLIPEDNYTVPPEAEGEEAAKQEPSANEDGEPQKITILRKEDNSSTPPADDEDVDPTALNPGATTRRHRYSPSRGSSVTTIAEAAEDDEDDEKPVASGASSALEFIHDRSREQMTLADSPEEGEITLPTAEDSVAGTVDEEERNDMGKTPSDTEPAPETQVSEEESHDAQEDVGSPGPAERGSDSEIAAEATSHKSEAESTDPEPAIKEQGQEPQQEPEPESEVEAETNNEPEAQAKETEQGSSGVESDEAQLPKDNDEPTTAKETTS